MRRDLLTLTVLLGLLGSGCSRAGETPPTTPGPDDDGHSDGGAGEVETAVAGAEEPDPPDPTAPAETTPGAPVEIRIRFIHVAATATKAGVTVSHAAEGGPAVLAGDLAYGTSSDYVAAAGAAGSTELPLSVEAGGAEGAGRSVSIAEGASHTAIVYSDPEGGEALMVALFRDPEELPTEDMRVRFFNAVLGWEELDVCLPVESADEPAETVFVGAAYGGLAGGEYVDLPAAARRLELRAASDEGYCTGRVLGAAQLRPPRGFALSSRSLTLVAIGRVSGRPVVPRALLVCQDAPAETPACFRAPIRAR